MKNPFIIGIAGGSGSGKTSLANALQSEIGSDKSLIFPIDAYYRDLSHVSLEKRDNVNFDHPDSLDLELFFEHLSYLKEYKPAKKPVYDFTTHTRLNYFEEIQPKDVIIAEGILLLTSKEIRKCIDFGIFLDVEIDTRLNRRIKRDVKERGRAPESVKMQYYSTVETMHNQYVSPSKQFADFILKDANISDWTNKVMLELNYLRVL